MNELAELTRYPQQSVSRYAAMLLGRYENQGGQVLSAPLVEQSINPLDPRKRALQLTVAGEKLVDRFVSRLAGLEVK